ncbi:MAG: response regulator transcription factor [Caldilineaceae bacterium]
MPRFDQLTPRQVEILTLIAKGLCNKEIAHQLNISVSTVQNHVAALLAALGVQNRTEAAKLYWQRMS